jgi:hypothetical protein
MIVSGVEELLVKAEACRQAALGAEDDDSRRTYLGLMAAWREIAGQVARIERVKRDATSPQPALPDVAVALEALARGTACGFIASLSVPTHPRNVAFAHHPKHFADGYRETATLGPRKRTIASPVTLIRGAWCALQR